VEEKNTPIKAILFLLIILLISIRPIPPIPVTDNWGDSWEENFNDGNIDGWELTTIHSDYRGWIDPTPDGGRVKTQEFHFTNGTAYHHFVQSREFYNYTRLSRPSKIGREATWTFDYYPGATLSSVTIVGERVMSGSGKFTVHKYAYRVKMYALPYPVMNITEFQQTFFTYPQIEYSGKPFIAFEKHYEFGNRAIHAIYESSDLYPDKWYHLNITRETDDFTVDLDGERILEYHDQDPFDKYWDFKKKEYQLTFGSHGQARVDNVSVTKNIENETTTETLKETEKAVTGGNLHHLVPILIAIIILKKKSRTEK
jgi:hypothetical protein